MRSLSRSLTTRNSVSLPIATQTLDPRLPLPLLSASLSSLISLALVPTRERKSPLNPVYCSTSTAYFSPKLNLHSKYSSSYLFGPAREEEEEEEESVGSISDTSPESTGESEEEIVSSESNESSICSVNGPVSILGYEPVYMRVGGLVRGKSKENLRLDVAGVRLDRPIDDYVQFNPPSAPPLPGSGDAVFSLARDEKKEDEELLQELGINEHKKTAYEFQPRVNNFNSSLGFMPRMDYMDYRIKTMTHGLYAISLTILIGRSLSFIFSEFFGGSAAIVREFFGYAANSILYNCGVYPEESFSKVKKYGLPMLLTQTKVSSPSFLA